MQLEVKSTSECQRTLNSYMKIQKEVLNNVKINFELMRNAVSRGELELQVQSFQMWHAASLPC